MRGYETALSIDDNGNVTRYESPCGVMRVLREGLPVIYRLVTNPHAGL